MIDLTDLLVVGYDGDRPVFTCHLSATKAATILTGTDADGDTAVEAVTNQATTAYSTVVTAMESVVVLPQGRAAISLAGKARP